MTCVNCGASNLESSVFCAGCGVALAAAAGGPVSAFAAASAARADSPVAGKIPVRGWLLLFCLELTVIGPIVLFFQAWQAHLLVLQAYNAVLAAFSIFVGIDLWAQKPRALLWVNLYFLSVLAAGAGSALVVIRAWWRQPDSVQINNLLGSEASHMLLVILSIGIWWWYFHVSRRVRATFGSNP